MEKDKVTGIGTFIWCRFLYPPIMIGTCTLRPPLVASWLLRHTCYFLVRLVSLKMLVPNNKPGCRRILVIWFVVVFTIFVWNWVSFDSSSWSQTQGPSTLSSFLFFYLVFFKARSTGVYHHTEKAHFNKQFQWKWQKHHANFKSKRKGTN